LGTDIGGSVRNPSHFCGVFGLKPSFGVVPQRGYLDGVGRGTTDADINVFGPIARSADDLALLLDVLAGPPPELSPAWRLALPEPRQAGVAGLRVGVWLDEPACAVDTAMRDVIKLAVDRFSDAGAHVEDVRPPVDPVEQVALFNTMILPAISPSLDPALADQLSGSHLAWLRNEQARAALRRRWADWFADWDVLLCPVALTPAFPHQQDGDFFTRTVEVNGAERSYVEHTWWTGLVGIAGLPSAVPPIGRTPAGLPVGVQVVAPFLHDRTAVQVAGLLAEVAGGYEPPPGFG
jgi:amidase